MYSYTLTLTSALDVVGGEGHAPAALPPGNPCTHCTGGWVGPRAPGRVRKFSPPDGIRSPDRPARSYTDCAIPARNEFL